MPKICTETYIKKYSQDITDTKQIATNLDQLNISSKNKTKSSYIIVSKRVRTQLQFLVQNIYNI